MQFDQTMEPLWSPSDLSQVQEVNQTLLETQKMLQMSYAQEKVRCGRIFDIFFK